MKVYTQFIIGNVPYVKELDIPIPPMKGQVLLDVLPPWRRPEDCTHAVIKSVEVSSKVVIAYCGSYLPKNPESRKDMVSILTEQGFGRADTIKLEG